MGSIHVSRVATGSKMGYGFDMTGTKGALRFDAEDQNALWYYDARLRRGRQGFAKTVDGARASGFPGLLRGAGPRHGLWGPDHHRGARLSWPPSRRGAGLSDVRRRAAGQPRDRGGGPLACGIAAGFRSPKSDPLAKSTESLMHLSIGNAPCSWGVEFADDPRNPAWTPGAGRGEGCRLHGHRTRAARLHAGGSGDPRA